jgi:hypothetical protein
MPPQFFESGNPIRHPLEDTLNADAWAILTAIARSRMAVMNVKGQLSEYYLELDLQELKKSGTLPGYVWLVNNPDFTVEWSGHTLRMECKNIRSKAALEKAGVSWRVEVQRTRDSKDGKGTRGYKVGDFDILAVCLFNRTGDWKFRFIASKRLARRHTDANLLEIFHEVPQVASGHWHDDITKALQDAIT